MSDYQPPFTLALGAGAPAGEITCTEVLRRLPGRRTVCLGRWREREVVVKIYHAARGAQRHWLCEKKGLEALSVRGIPAPELLYAGADDRGGAHLLILARIAPAMTLREAWAGAAGDAEKAEVLRAAMETFAGLHRAGLIQGDPHWNNFLLSGGRVYVLDGADIEAFTALQKARALDNLTDFFAAQNLSVRAFVGCAYRHYARAMNRAEPSDGEIAELTACIVGKYELNARKYLAGKIFRNCTAFGVESGWRSRLIFSRSYDTPSMRELLGDPETWVERKAERILKRGGSSTIAVVRVGGRPYAIKRYARNGWWPLLKSWFRPSRAARSWANAHRLRLYDIDTAAPVALIERGWLRRRDYLVTEYVEGELLSVYLPSPERSGADKREVAERLLRMLAQLAEHRISHGDLKATNIVVAGQAPYLQDLDAMVQHRSASFFARRFRADLARFMENWADCPEIAGMFGHRLDSPLPASHFSALN